MSSAFTTFGGSGGISKTVDTTMARRNRRARDAELDDLHETILQASTPAAAPAPAAPFDMNQLVEALQLAQGGGARKQIKAPTYNGVGDIEIFISQFTDISRSNRWTAEEQLLHLRLSLTEKAQECGQFDTTEEILEELRSRYGLTYQQARDRLNNLRRTPNTSIHELGMEITKLVRLGYPNMMAADREDIAMDRFSKVMNNVELKRYLLPMRPQTMRECIRLTDEFLQADASGSRTPRLTAVAEEQNPMLECMQALQQTVGQALQQMQQQQAFQMQMLMQQQQQQSQLPQFAAPAAPTSAPTTRPRQKTGCYHCNGPHLKRDCPQLKPPAPSPAPTSTQQRPAVAAQTAQTAPAAPVQMQPAENYKGPAQ